MGIAWRCVITYALASAVLLTTSPAGALRTPSGLESRDGDRPLVHALRRGGLEETQLLAFDADGRSMPVHADFPDLQPLIQVDRHGDVYVATQNQVWRLDPRGFSPRGSARFDDGITAFAVDGKTLYVATRDGALQIVDFETGRPQERAQSWVGQISGVSAVFLSSSPLAITAQAIWELRLGSRPGQKIFSFPRLIPHTLTCYDHHLYWATEGGALHHMQIFPGGQPLRGVVLDYPRRVPGIQAYTVVDQRHYAVVEGRLGTIR